MKFKKIMLVSLILLAILTIGAVSATDELTVDEDAGDILNAPAEDVDLISDDDDYNPDGGLDNPEEEVTGTEDVGITVDFPEEVVAGEVYELNITFDKEATGSVYVSNSNGYPYDIYDKSVSADFQVWEFGDQTYEINYSGDDTYAPKTISGTFTVSKYIISCDDLYKRYGETNTLYILAPHCFENDITLIVNGKDEYQVSKSENGDYYFDVEGLKYGQNTVRLIYHDETYGDFDGTYNATTTGSIVIRDDGAHLTLPEDANGTLSVYKQLYDEEDNYLGEEFLANATMKDGYACVPFDNLPLGYASIHAEYVGDEKYEVYDLTGSAYIGLKVTVPRVVFPGKEAYAEMRVPGGISGTFLLSEECYDDDIEDYVRVNYTGEVVNGYGKIPLSTLNGESHYLYASFIDNNGTIYDNEGLNDFSCTVIDIDSINVIEGVEEGDELLGLNSVYISYPEELNANGKVFLDDKFVKEVNSSDNEVYFDSLKEGNHKITFKYEDENCTFTKEVSFKIVSCKIDIPPEFDVNGESISVYLSENTTGTLKVYIDGKEYYSQDVSDTANYVYVNDVFKTHKVKVTFTDALTKKVTVAEEVVDFRYSIYCSINDPYAYGRDNQINIYVPEDISGNIAVKIDGKTRKWTSNGYNIIVNISDLTVGDHDISVSLKGDKKYYDSQEDSSFEVCGVISFSYYDDSVSLILPADAKGKLLVDISTYSYDEEMGDEITNLIEHREAKMVKGKAICNISDLKLGRYFIQASYDGDDYNVGEESEDFYINLNIDNDEFYLNKSSTINVTVPKADNGIVNLTIGEVIGEDDEFNEIVNVLYSKELPANNAKFTFTPKKLGKHNIVVNLIVDGNVTASSEFYCYVSPDEFIFPEDLIYNKTANITMKLPSDATGEMVVGIYALKNAFDEEDEEITIETLKTTLKSGFTNGVAYVEIPSDLALGNYVLKVNYTGNKGDFKENVYLSVIPNVEGSEQLTTGESGNVVFDLAGIDGDIEVEINDKKVTPSINDGKATINIPKDLNTGNNQVIIRYKDTEGNNRSVSKFVFVKDNVDLNVNVGSATVTTDLIIKVSLSNKLAPGNVTVKLNNVEKTADIECGVATFNFGKLPYGNYNAVVTFNGNDRIAPATKNVTAKVTYDQVIKANNYNAFYNEGKYSVTVYGFDKKVAVETPVTFKINGKFFKKVKTNNKGVASIKITQIPKTYKITTDALGKSVTKTLKVKQVLTLKAVKVKKSAKKLVLTATLKSKKAIKGKVITFKFNGKTFKAKTNKKGIAKVTIKKSVLKKLKVGKKITYQATYIKDTVKKSVKVKK